MQFGILYGTLYVIIMLLFRDECHGTKAEAYNYLALSSAKCNATTLLCSYQYYALKSPTRPRAPFARRFLNICFNVCLKVSK